MHSRVDNKGAPRGPRISFRGPNRAGRGTETERNEIRVLASWWEISERTFWRRDGGGKWLSMPRSRREVWGHPIPPQTSRNTRTVCEYRQDNSKSRFKVGLPYRVSLWLQYSKIEVSTQQMRKKFNWKFVPPHHIADMLFVQNDYYHKSGKTNL